MIHGDTVSALRDSLNRLFAFLADARIEIPTEQVWILELRSNVARDERGRLRVSRAELRGPEAYETRFNEILASGLPWINVSCWGVDGQRMIVVVETPSAIGLPSPWTSINYSGPTNGTRARGWDVGELLALE